MDAVEKVRDRFARHGLGVTIIGQSNHLLEKADAKPLPL